MRLNKLNYLNKNDGSKANGELIWPYVPYVVKI